MLGVLTFNLSLMMEFYIKLSANFTELIFIHPCSFSIAFK